MSYVPVGPKPKAFAMPVTFATDEGAIPITGTITGIPTVRMSPFPVAPVMTKYTPGTTAYVKVTPNANALAMYLRPVVTTEDLIVASLIVHKIADTTTIAATVPAVSEAESYALAIELKGDYNTHIASTVYHDTADAGECTLANATSEATLVALVNNLRTLFATHYAATGVHGGKADAVGIAAVAATTVATNAATAIVLENALAAAHAAHLAVTDLATYLTHSAATMPLAWPCLGAFWCKTNVSGHSFVTEEFRSA